MEQPENYSYLYFPIAGIFSARTGKLGESAQQQVYEELLVHRGGCRMLVCHRDVGGGGR